MLLQYSKPLQSQAGLNKVPLSGTNFCLILLSVAMVNSMTESNLGEEKVYFSLQVLVHYQGGPGPELKAGCWSRDQQMNAAHLRA